MLLLQHDWPEIGVGGALAFCLLLIGGFMRWLTSQPRGNGKAGDRSAEFWENQFRTIIEDVMDRRNVMLKVLIHEAVREELNNYFRRYEDERNSR